jgi:hypothetical protein
MLLILRKPELNTRHLHLLLAHESMDDGLLDLIYSHPQANEKIREKVCQHPSFSAINLLNLLVDQSITTSSVLYLLQSPSKAIAKTLMSPILNQFAHNPGILLAISEHECVDNVDLLNKLVQRSFALLGSAISENEKQILEKCLINTIKKLHALNNMTYVKELIQKNSRAIPSKLGAVILVLLGTSLLPHLPLNKMIEAANDPASLDPLIRIKELTAADLEQLADKPLSPLQIHLLLERQDMIPKVADILFANSNYDRTIKNWPWLKQKQLINILDTSSDFESLNIALHHKNLPSRARDHWFDSVRQQQKHKQQKALAAQNPTALLDSALEKLRIKALSHMTQATKKESYNEAAKIVFNAYKKLSAQKNDLITKPDTAIRPFVQTINDARPVLAVHRGYKKVFLDILNAVLTFVSLGLKACTTNNWRFFNANTDSINVLNEIKECINQFRPKPQLGDDGPEYLNTPA